MAQQPPRLIGSVSRFKSMGLVALAALLLGITVLGLMPQPRYSSMLQQSVHSAGHFFLFGAATLLLTIVTPVLWPSLAGNWRRQYVIGFCGGVAMGVLLEFAQSFTASRSASLIDIGYDVLGSLAGIAMLIVIDRPPEASASSRSRVTLAAVAILITVLTLGISPVGFSAYCYHARTQSLPTLLAFDQLWANMFLWKDSTVTIAETTAPEGWPARWGCFRVTIRPGIEYAGIGMAEPSANWATYETLVFETYGVSSFPIDAVIRVHDFQHNDQFDDRFNRRLTIQPGRQTNRISLRKIRAAPRDRDLDMTSVAGIKLFLVDSTREVEFLTSNWRLEKRR